MKVNTAFVFILIIATLLAIHTPVHSYPAITLTLGRFELGLLSWPSHLLSKVSSPSIGGRILLQLRCIKVAPKVSTTMWTLGEITATDYIERESYGTLIAILYLNFYVWSFYPFLLDSSTYTNSFLVSSPFIIGDRLLSQAFAPPQLGASSIALFPSLHALERSSPVVFIKNTRDFLLYNFYTVFALSFIWELFFSLHLLSHYSTSLDHTSTPAQSLCALVQFLFSRFLPIPCLCLTVAHPVTTPLQLKIGCQSLFPFYISLPLSGSSSISLQEITITESSFFREIIALSDP